MPTGIWSSRLRSGSAHCDLELPLGSGARGGGPAVPTGICEEEEAEEVEEADAGRRRRTALIKSNNPHLAGGEKTIFDNSLGENPWGKPKKTRENQQKTIFGNSLGKPHWQNQKTSRKPKKTKKQNFSENVWSEAHVCFFGVLPSFLFFLGLDLEKTKTTQGFLVFWIKWWLKNCEKQKNSRFFWFLGVCGFRFFLAAQWKTKSRKL